MHLQKSCKITELHSTRRLNLLVRKFIREVRGSNRQEIDFYRSQKSLVETLAKAGMAETPEGRIHGHQRRIGRRKLIRLRDCLMDKLDRIKNIEDKDFDNLMAVVVSCAEKGIGELTVYDTSFRIGVFLNIYPDKIYLHRGTTIGALLLLGKTAIRGKKCLEKAEFPQNLQSLEPYEIEDFLCIFKNRIQP